MVLKAFSRSMTSRWSRGLNFAHSSKMIRKVLILSMEVGPFLQMEFNRHSWIISGKNNRATWHQLKLENIESENGSGNLSTSMQDDDFRFYRGTHYPRIFRRMGCPRAMWFKIVKEGWKLLGKSWRALKHHCQEPKLRILFGARFNNFIEFITRLGRTMLSLFPSRSSSITQKLWNCGWIDFFLRISSLMFWCSWRDDFLCSFDVLYECLTNLIMYRMVVNLWIS